MKLRPGSAPFATLCSAALAAASLIGGCGRETGEPRAALDGDRAAPDRVRLQLNWIAEPEFGGIFAARAIGAFERRGLEVEIIQGGPGTPAPQLVAEGRVEFGIVSGDQILTLREKGGRLAALFAIFQVNPTAVMVRREGGAATLEALWRSDARIALEPGLPYITFLNRRFGGERLRLVSAGGGVAAFESGAVDAQQCFISAEPAQMDLRGIPVRVFPLAESGYNPYAAVVVTREAYLEPLRSGDRTDARPDGRSIAERLTLALREGWEAYQADPGRFNPEIHQLNRAMSLDAMNLAARIQHDYVAPTEGLPWGAMTLERWRTLAEQMTELGLLERVPGDLASIVVEIGGDGAREPLP
ncbi:MAG TPA: ABC transporter substrate-binding protein [Phycisphaerales bacterium]|nr:ABC transporter substrate-binding protein [Phycisphaerales bacterium]HMP37798.1 ABC transporter substrate-binding protein [Phycisphaerales bacterium]